jgi:hypothetical protein
MRIHRSPRSIRVRLSAAIILVVSMSALGVLSLPARGGEEVARVSLLVPSSPAVEAPQAHTRGSLPGEYEPLPTTATGNEYAWEGRRVQQAPDRADVDGSIQYVGSVALEPTRGVAGTKVTISGSGFEPDTALEVVWNSVEGRWLLEGAANESFMGREFMPTRTAVASATAGADGGFSAGFVAPMDFGFSHDVTVERGGQLLNKAGFRLEPRLTVTPASGPVGTPITVRLEGVGWANLENSWMLTYDNQFTGLLSSVTSGGLAEAVIPATGGPGLHQLRVVHGAFTVPYLNGQQSPRPDRSDYVFDFEVTEEEAVMPAAAAAQALPVEPATPPPGDGVAVWADVASGPVGTPMTVSGRALPPGAELQLQWSTVVGNRVSGDGWEEIVADLEAVKVGPDGTFTLASTIPDDLGGPHRLLALVDGEQLAETSITITPSLVSAERVSGAYGDSIEIRLKGVGWTETANIYNLVYDNGYLGYACGFNSQGAVTINLPVTGSAGWHYVDLYPGIYKGKDIAGLQNFRIPQLTYADDHPGEQLPAFRVALEVLPHGEVVARR